MQTETAVLKKLDEIKSEIDYIKKHMINADSILSEEDYILLQEYRNEKKEKKLVSHANLKKELGI